MSQATRHAVRLLSSRDENIEAIRRALRWLRADPLLWAQLIDAGRSASAASAAGAPTAATTPTRTPRLPEV